MSEENIKERYVYEGKRMKKEKGANLLFLAKIARDTNNKYCSKI